MAPAIWFDIGDENATVRNCLIADNEDAGIFYEISYGLNAHDNVIVGNGFASTAGRMGRSSRDRSFLVAELCGRTQFDCWKPRRFQFSANNRALLHASTIPIQNTTNRFGIMMSGFAIM